MSRSNHATIGCAFASDEALIATVRELADNGDVCGWRVGATDKSRAMRLCELSGTAGSEPLDPLDPLHGVAGVASSAEATARVNRGALTGGAAGAVAGVLLGFTGVAAIVPAADNLRSTALTLLCFAVGVAAGGVLGGAIGTRASTHAGFRLVDAMEAGHAAAIGDIAADRIDAVRAQLEAHGASEIIVIDG